MAKSQTFETILNKIRKESKNSVELGTAFEKLTKDFLLIDLQYKMKFTKVVLWKDFEHRFTISQGGIDVGVDLVGYENDGSFCAIQCKCYADDGSINLKGLSTFFTTATSMEKKLKKKVNTILVYTGDGISPNLNKAIDNHKCHLIWQTDFHNSSIIWDNFPKIATKKPNELYQHQKNALDNVIQGLNDTDRGQMIMACGTGKTLTSLRIAEKHAGIGKTVLYLVPSISLIQQTMREWSQNAKIKHHYNAVCSDKTVGDDEAGSINDLAIPPSTDKKQVRESFSKRPKNAMGVIFSTYQSIDVASKAVDCFDLILCDEAHRTTGARKISDKDSSYFTKVHHNTFVKSKKRLYMTATPKIYGEIVKKNDNALIHSMDDVSIFGEEFHNYSFGQAVSDENLVDFKVRIPIIPEEDLKMYTNESIERGGTNDDGTIDERVLLAAVWHGLNYNNKTEKHLLQRIISFSNRIQASKKFSGVYSNSDETPDEISLAQNMKTNEDDDRSREDRSFENIVSKYEEISENKTGNSVVVRHMDGKMHSNVRHAKLNWLKNSDSNSKECRILSNARCLSEGVDVPALDGVVFLQPRKSKIDVIQSVGRVMRKSPDKRYGHVILPVVIPAGMDVEQSLDKKWKIVWDVLAALRSHNPEFGNVINRLNLDRSSSNSGSLPENVEIIWMGSLHQTSQEHKLFGKILTKMVDKVGDRNYFDVQSKELGKKANEIKNILIKSYKDGQPQIIKTVDKLCLDLKEIVNDSINDKATINVLAQHHALKQVFDVLFPKEFRSSNPVAQVLDEAIDQIGLKNELKEFSDFYDKVQDEAKRFETDNGKQNYIKTIYGNFMLGFDKKIQEQSGIVYTPDEVIDFIIHFVQDVLNKEFDTSLDNTDVKVFDPFTGTGAFIARLLESGLIKKNLRKKFKHDIWANEISLLAYYVAAVNIETTYKKISNSNNHVSFDNVNFTDTLNHHPKYRLDKQHRMKTKRLDGSIQKVQENILKENWQHIHVIMGNPPYSGGQSDYNDQNQNVSYPELDERIKNTYTQKIPHLGASAKKSLRDSYIRSIRWATDRIGDSGIIAFITNASFIASDAGSGIRACLKEEFTDVWCFDLRGDARTKGEQRRKEGGNVFGSGSRAPVAITILIKNPKQKKHIIHYKDIGDYLSQTQKLKIIQESKSISGIKDWQNITPDRHNDWVEQRSEEFYRYDVMGNKDTKKGKSNNAIFKLYSGGLGTSRDMWAYNSSKDTLSKNMKRHIDYCIKHGPIEPEKIDPTQAKWTTNLTRQLKTKNPRFKKEHIRIALYRPFFKQYLYFNNIFNHSMFQMPKLFPEGDSENIVICISDKGKSGMFSAIVTDITPDMHIIEQSQCFPLYAYENKDKKINITDFILSEYQNYYKDKKITKTHIFYYVYGMLHHSGYKKKFANNLSKELPHIPMAPNFWDFYTIGERLSKLHLNFDSCKRYDLGKPKVKFDKFTKLAFGKKKIKENGKEKSVDDKTKLRIDGVEIFDNIPEIKYAINGRTPLEWIIDKYEIKTDTDSGIENNPCSDIDIIAIIERAACVGVDSDKIISQLPKEFEPKNWTPTKIGLDKFS